MKYTRIISSLYSPENGDKVEDGITLLVLPKRNVKMKQYDTHFFVSSKDYKTKAKHGWIKIIEEFSLEDFIKQYMSGLEVNEEMIEAVKIMLESIAKLEDKMPVCTDYSLRGVLEKKHMILTVHRVILRGA
jgi:hypothetical protein